MQVERRWGDADLEKGRCKLREGGEVQVERRGRDAN